MSWSLSSLSASVSSLASSVQASVTALVAEQKQKLAQEQAKLEETKQKQEQAEQAKQRGAYPLWTVYTEDQGILEAELKERILKLATDIKTWQIPDPREQFPCTMDFLLPFVVESLKHDKNLERTQYRLVPRKMSEEKFWRLYMYQVERIRAEMQVGSLFSPPKSFRVPESVASVAVAPPVSSTSSTSSSSSSSSSSTPSKPSRIMELTSMLSVEEPHASDSDYVSDDNYVKVAANKKLLAAAAASSSSSSSSTTTTTTSTTSIPSTATSSSSRTAPNKPRTDDDDLEELESMLADVDVSGDMLSGDTQLNELNDLVIEEELP